MKKVSRIFDFMYHQLENHPIDRALVTKRNGKWEALSTKAYVAQANRMSRGLLQLGVGRKDKIAVISSANCSEWNILDIGVLQIGAQNVPIYPTISPESYAYILKHSQAKYVFVSNQDILEKINKAKPGSQVKKVFSFAKLENCAHWEEVLKLGDDESNQAEVDQIKKNIDSDDLATLIYTSGTTGKPKGVMLSHKNITSNVIDSAPRVPFNVGSEIALSFLPVCHVFERMLIYLYQYYSVSIHYAESIDAIPNNLQEIRPTFITAVPRVLEKFYAAFQAKGQKMTGLKRLVFHWAINLGLQFEPYGSHSRWYKFQLKWARKLVFSKWKDGLGGRLSLIVSGSAALPPELSHIFAAADMIVLEGYGLTETSPVISVNTNRKEDFKIGTVGKPIDHVKVKIDKDGEILVKGSNVMIGYYKNKEKTETSFTTEGYFRTGDIGELDDDGFLKITDRKKQVFKTSGGKYISPQKIENELKKSRFIEQIIILGEGEKMPAALIQPDFSFVKKWAKHKNIPLEKESVEEICTHQQIINRIKEDVSAYNENLGHWEQVKDFRLTPEEWSIEAGLLTPTLKVKRKEVIAHFQDLYGSIYDK